MNKKEIKSRLKNKDCSHCYYKLKNPSYIKWCKYMLEAPDSKTCNKFEDAEEKIKSYG